MSRASFFGVEGCRLSIVDNGWQLGYTVQDEPDLKSPSQTQGRDHARMDSESRDLLTVDQAAQYLQLSQSSIRSYIRQGKLNAFRIAGKRKVLIPRTELLKLLEPARAHEVEALLDEDASQGDSDPDGAK